MLLQDVMVGYDINVPISGDITIGLWFGDHKGEWDSPVMAYAFHTAFVDQVRCKHAPAKVLAWFCTAAGADL